MITMIFADPADDMTALSGRSVVIRDGYPFAGRNKISIDAIAEQRPYACQHRPAVTARVVSKVDDPTGDMTGVQAGDDGLKAVGDPLADQGVIGADPGNGQIGNAVLQPFAADLAHAVCQTDGAARAFRRLIAVIPGGFLRGHDKAMPFAE